MLFTPSLGLFDCLHHGRLAAIAVKDGQRIFDFSSDGSQFNFSDAWKPLEIKDISYFPDIPVIAVLGILITMIILHIFTTSLVLKQCFKQPFRADFVIQGFHSLICPPLHLDWEFFYRLHAHAKDFSVLRSWKRYVKTKDYNH